jgi:predicted Zn finger-like uncharacterized protein
MPNQTASTIDSHADAVNQLTECPSCETVFRVTERQLQIADGRVRCGSCLHVFVAAEHWTATIDPQQKVMSLSSPAPVAGEQPLSQAATANKDANCLSAAALKHHATIEFSDAFMALEESNSPGSPLVDGSCDDSDPEDDEDWARQMLEAEATSEHTPGKRALQAILETREDSSSKPGQKNTAKPADTPYNPGEFETTESWMQELLGAGQAEDSAFDAPIPPAPEPMPVGGETDEEYIPEIFRERSALLDGIQAEPLEMHWRHHISPWIRHGLTMLGIAAGATLLLAQYAWFNAAQLAANPKYRPQIALFCQISGCTMPANADITRIKNSNLVVVKHPRVEDALLLDTVLTNYASFEQPFPVLYVRFSNLQDKTVAARTFTPHEYLRGDLAGHNTMPVRQPIHLSLELRDPGEEASNYRIQLLPADPE